MQLQFNRPLAILAWMVFVVPAIGVPNELMLQDTLKSAIVALCVLCSALLLFWSLRQCGAKLRWHGLVWLPLALMAYALASMVWSHTYLAAVEAIRWFVLGLLLWLGLNTINRDTLPTLSWGIHAGATAASVWAAFQFWGDLTVFPQAFGIAPGSTFVNRNFFAEYAVCALPFSMGLLISMRASRWLVWMAIGVAFNIVTLMMTGTRSALMALLLMTPVFAIVLVRFREQFACTLWSRTQRLMVGCAVVVTILGLGSIPSQAPLTTLGGTAYTALQRSFIRVSSVATEREYSQGTFSTRVLMWKATARMMMDNPWQGVGAGAWEVQIPRYQRLDTTLETDYYTHNEALQLLSEYGVVGGLVLAFLLAYILHTAGSTWRLRGLARQEAPVRVVALISLMSLLVVSCAGFPLHMAMTGTLLALCLAILASSDARLGDQTASFASDLPWRRAYAKPAILVTVVCLATAAWITVQAARVEYKLIHAIHIANGLMQGIPSDNQARAARKAEMLNNIREAIAINPHYRKVTAELAEPLAKSGDWESATWILESVVASRPHVTALWTGLATGHSRLGQHDRAQAALEQVQRLKPDTLPTRTLEVMLLSRSGQLDEAIAKLNHWFDDGAYDYGMVQAAYAVGYQARNWPLAIRSQELRIATWPGDAADGYFRLGLIYSNSAVHDDAKALAAFKAGLNQVPPQQQDNYRRQVPQPFRDRI